MPEAPLGAGPLSPGGCWPCWTLAGPRPASGHACQAKHCPRPIHLNLGQSPAAPAAPLFPFRLFLILLLHSSRFQKSHPFNTFPSPSTTLQRFYVTLIAAAPTTPAPHPIRAGVSTRHSACQAAITVACTPSTPYLYPPSPAGSRVPTVAPYDNSGLAPRTRSHRLSRRLGFAAPSLPPLIALTLAPQSPPSVSLLWPWPGPPGFLGLLGSE